MILCLEWGWEIKILFFYLHRNRYIYLNCVLCSSCVFSSRNRNVVGSTSFDLLELYFSNFLWLWPGCFFLFRFWSIFSISIIDRNLLLQGIWYTFFFEKISKKKQVEYKIHHIFPGGIYFYWIIHQRGETRQKGEEIYVGMCVGDKFIRFNINLYTSLKNKVVAYLFNVVILLFPCTLCRHRRRFFFSYHTPRDLKF